MKTPFIYRIAFFFLLHTALQAHAAGPVSRSDAGSPLHVYLTWQGDTATTITVNYHTSFTAPSQVYYDTLAHDGDSAAYAFRAAGKAHQIAGTDGRWIHWIEF